MMRRVRFWIEAAGFEILGVLARILPRRALLGIGSFAGTLGYLLDGRHRRIALDNLEHAFGGTLDARAARRIVLGCWRHFGRITLDSLTFSGIGPDAIDRLVRYQGLEHIQKAYERGRGVLLFSAHFGHWELIALMQGYLDMPLTLVARRLDNPHLERQLAALRCRSGNRIVHKRNAVRGMLQAIGEGIGVAIVIDQDARSTGVFVPFFGRQASTTPTLALLALRTGAAVIPTYSVPRPDGTYLVVYEPEIELRSTADRDADILDLTARCTARIECWVREHPELWLWMHRRWKTRPPSE